MNRTAPRRMNSSASSSAPSGGNNSNGPNSNPFLESYRAWSERTPWITRVSTIIVLVSYVLSFFLDLEEFLANIPQFSIFYFEFYRIFLSPLVGNSFIFLLIMLLSYPAIGKNVQYFTHSNSLSRDRFKDGVKFRIGSVLVLNSND